MTTSIAHQERARLRKGRTPEFYRQFVAQFPASGLTRTQYCRKHHVGESTFIRYAKESTADFRSRTPSKRKLFVRKTEPRMIKVINPTPPSLGHQIEIVFQNGLLLRIHQLDANILATLKPLLLGSHH